MVNDEVFIISAIHNLKELGKEMYCDTKYQPAQVSHEECQEFIDSYPVKHI